ncbi:hypothetical protein A8H39_02010 [Paraburkholderia fungorum]|uniref:hypothetical protein n=1 Tax=Paraburkholderia fungorum TaxID=134537 RepID=UPI00048758AF|nr:hypothetical protein [Paraburkholderia fungorum]MBB5546576.1 hypothetical protein [Paraburkholderia fungorum]PNE59946.1 hypothetical protein A8H39_02010 [Paraburkholderia fungorum]
MKKMTKAAVMLMGVAPALAMADSAPKVLQSRVTTENYLASATSGVMVPAQAWEGEKIVQLGDGACQRITHSKLRIENAGDAQKATVEESASPVACPA